MSALQTSAIRIYMFTFMYLAADFIQRELQEGNKGKTMSKSQQCCCFFAIKKEMVLRYDFIWFFKLNIYK